jgi:hypothetical protein
MSLTGRMIRRGDRSPSTRLHSRSGYLLKERVFDIATVVDALRRIADEETVIEPTIRTWN